MGNQTGRASRIAWVVGVLLLVGSLVGAHFILRRPAPDADTPPADAAWDVVCSGHVDAEGGVAMLTVPLPGRVVAIPAREGQTVKDGDVLLKLDDAQAKLRVDEAEAALASARVQADAAKKYPEQHRIQLAQQQQAVEAAKQRLIAARLLLDRKRELLAINQLTPGELMAAEAQIKELESGERAEQARQRELQLVDPDLKVRQAEAELQVVQVKVKQAKQALEQCELRAPSAGQVLRVNVAVGDIIGATPQSVILFRPEGPLVVRAEIEQEFAGRVKKGQRVTVSDDADLDAPKWTGRVERLSGWIARRRSVLFEPDQINDVRTLEGVIHLDDGQAPLRIGQRVKVTIHPN